MNKKERMHWVDIARGFFMIAIVLGHVFHSGYLRHWVFSYHVPAFFFLAGYCFKYIQDVQQFMKKKVRTIVIPYLIFSLMSIVLFAIAQLVIPKVGTLLECDLVTNFFVMQYGNSKPETMRYNLPLWFLPCFFCVTILAYIVEKLSRIKGRQIRYISMVIAAILGGMVGIYNTITLPWHFETALSMLVWYLAGITVREKQDYFCKKVDHFPKKGLIQIFGSVCMIIVGYGIAFLNNCTVGVRNDHYGIIPVYYLAAVLGITGIIWISLTIKKNKVMEYIGRNSIVILVLHRFPILVFQELVPFTAGLLNYPNTITGILCGLAVLSISILLSLFAGEIIKIICPWVLGNRTKNAF